MHRTITSITSHTADEDYHIKRQIANLVRRAESAQNKPRNSFRSSRQVIKKIATPETKAQVFWKQFQRQPMNQSTKRRIVNEPSLSRSSSQQGKRCRSAFYRQMFQDQDKANERTESLIKRKLEARVIEQQHPVTSPTKGTKQLVERYIFKQRPSLRRQFSTDSDLYLESKRKAPERRSIVSQQVLSLIKM